MTKTEDGNSAEQLEGVSSGSDVSLSKERRKELAAAEEILGHRFSDLELLNRALTHSSFKNFAADCHTDYESLEFLGDAILEFVVSEALYERLPQHSAGELTKLRSLLVSRARLAALSRDAGLERFILLSPGEDRTGGRRKKTILGDIFESLVAALYLDGGLTVVTQWILGWFDPLLQEMQRGALPPKDHKSRLQELLHTRRLREPDYRILEEKGPDHRKEFLVEAWIDKRPVARAWGRSKREAEQQAARLALEAISAPDADSGEI